MSGDNQSIDGLCKELFAFCRSESLSKEGLREIIERYGAQNVTNYYHTNYEFFDEACQNNLVTEGIIRLLLECLPDAIRYIDEEEKFTPLHIMCAFNKNVTPVIVQLLIDAFPDSLRHEDSSGRMPLHTLCCNEDLDEEVALDILKLLLERCPESVHNAANNGSLPIHVAAQCQSPDFCRILIEAYPGSERMTHSCGFLPLHMACQYNSLATVEYLLEVYPGGIDMADIVRRYPIHCAIRGLADRSDTANGIEVVEFLLNYNANVALQKYDDKFPLYSVCVEIEHEFCGSTGREFRDKAHKLNAYLKVIQLLYGAYPEAMETDEMLSNIGCQELQRFINTQLTYARQARDHRVMTTIDENGQLPLHRALCDNATLGSIKLLVAGNSSALRHADNRGMIPLHVACQLHDSPRVVEYLTDLNSSTLKMKDMWQNTLLHFACGGANHAMIAFLLEKYDAAFVSTRNSQKQLPIDLLFDSEAVSDRKGIEYMESIYRLIRANRRL
jgi:ankyrin repeat protein